MPVDVPVKIGPDHWRARVTDGWVPLPEELLEQLGWQEGDEVECVPFDGNRQLVIRKKSVTTDP